MENISKGESSHRSLSDDSSSAGCGYKLPKANAASTNNDGRSSSATGSNNESDESSQHQTKNNVKKSNTDVNSVENSNKNMDSK